MNIYEWLLWLIKKGDWNVSSVLLPEENQLFKFSTVQSSLKLAIHYKTNTLHLILISNAYQNWFQPLTLHFLCYPKIVDSYILYGAQLYHYISRSCSLISAFLWGGKRKPELNVLAMSCFSFRSSHPIADQSQCTCQPST